MIAPLDDIIRKVRDLPSLPVIVLELLTTLDQPGAHTDLLAEQISYDQGLSAKTLRLANSSFYGMATSVTTLPKAIAILGQGTVRMLVYTASITPTLSPASNSTFPLPQFWQHALATAICARNLAPALGLAADTAFIAGLMHDIGQVVLATQFADAYATVLQNRIATDTALLAAERTVLGIDHATIGAALMTHWRFPQAFVDAVAQHHEPQTESADELVLAVHLANALVHALDLAGDSHEQVAPIADPAWTRLAVTPESLARIMRDSETEYWRISQVFLE